MSSIANDVFTFANSWGHACFVAIVSDNACRIERRSLLLKRECESVKGNSLSSMGLQSIQVRSVEDEISHISALLSSGTLGAGGGKEVEGGKRG